MPFSESASKSLPHIQSTVEYISFQAPYFSLFNLVSFCSKTTVLQIVNIKTRFLQAKRQSNFCSRVKYVHFGTIRSPLRVYSSIHYSGLGDALRVALTSPRTPPPLHHVGGLLKNSWTYAKCTFHYSFLFEEPQKIHNDQKFGMMAF